MTHRGLPRWNQNRRASFAISSIVQKFWSFTVRMSSPKSLLCQTLTGLCRLFRIHICCIHVPLAVQTLHHRFGVTAISKCRIKPCLTWLNLEKSRISFTMIEICIPAGVFPLLITMLDRVLYSSGLMFLIFFFKFAWIFSFVSYSSFVWCLCFLFHSISPF